MSLPIKGVILATPYSLLDRFGGPHSQTTKHSFQPPTPQTLFPPSNAMFCHSSRQMADEDYENSCLLVPSTTGFVQAKSSRGRLYYLPSDSKSSENTPSGYFRSRVARPSLLSVVSVAAEQSSCASRPAVSFDPKPSCLFEKLARSREQAKRFLRFSFSLHSTPPVQPVPYELPAEHSCNRSEPGDMVFADAGRRSPIRRERGSSVVGGPISGMVHRPRLAEDVRRASVSSVTGESTISIPSLASEKPIVSGNGVSISISLAEPVLYLQGFDQNDTSSQSTTMLRGSMLLRVTKQAKIKTISLNFRGRSETDWPEGIPPKRVDFKDTTTIMNHTWSFFNVQMPQAEHSYGADILHLQKGTSIATKEIGVTGSSFDIFQRSSSPAPPTSREARRLSLQNNQSRSFGKGESITGGPTVAQKGFKIFHPGDYVYNFELPLDSRLPESIAVDLGNVKYELEALVERSGAFRANLMGSKELTLIRAPSEGSLEQTEPIAISRNWEDQLHYDIVISGKSFPLGSQVPIAFKLTPLAKVQCHRIKVFVTENIQYFTNNKRVHRLEPTRKVQLFEKRADGHSVSSYPGSSIRITAGGGISYDYRAAAAAGNEDVPRDESNLLGNLDNDSGSVGPTEMEFNIQLPSCHMMKDKLKSERLHFDTTYKNIQVNHWIKIVMRLSRPDENDPTKRRHFEISIDSPFNILSCRATQANTSLPAYSSGTTGQSPADEYECGCPGAALRRRSTPPSQNVPSLSNLRQDNNSTASVDSETTPHPPTRSWTNNSGGLTLPTQAHVHDPNSGPPRSHDPNQGAARPIHLMRAPSFNPPPFDEDEAPPPLVTPPPNYENIVSGTSQNALADYFARLADELGDEDDHEDRGRVDVPLTPGGRVNRSMDARRDWLPLSGAAATVAAAPAAATSPSPLHVDIS